MPLTDTCSCDESTCDVTWNADTVQLPDYMLVSDVTVTIPADTEDVITINVLDQGIKPSAHDVIAMSVPAGASLPITCEIETPASSFYNFLQFENVESRDTNISHSFVLRDVSTYALWTLNRHCYIAALFTTPITIYPPSDLTDDLDISQGHTFTVDLFNEVGSTQANLSVTFVPTSLEILEPCFASTDPGTDDDIDSEWCILPTGVVLFLVRVTSAESSLTAHMNYSSVESSQFSSECPSNFLNSSHCLNSIVDPYVKYALLNVSFRHRDAGNVSLVVEACGEEECVGLLLPVELQRLINIWTQEFIHDPIYAGLNATVGLDFVGRPFTIIWSVDGEPQDVDLDADELEFYFDQPGAYRFAVNISNALSFDFLQDDVYAFDVFNATDISAAVLSNRYPPVTALGARTPISSYANFSSYNLGRFKHDFGDGSNVECKDVENLEDHWEEVESEIWHVFEEAGEIEVNVTLLDPLLHGDCDDTTTNVSTTYGFLTSYIQVWIPISSVSLEIDPYPVESGQPVVMKVEQVDGTGNMTLTVDFNDGSLSESVNGSSRENFTHVYSEAGRYNVTAIASNIVTHAYNETVAWVQDRISGFALPSYVTTPIGNITDVTVELENGTDVTYILSDDVGHNITQTAPTFSINYTLVGNYTVQVRAENAINNESGSTLVVVHDLSPFNFFGIVYDPCVATGEVALEANISYHNLNWLRFTWRFGDGIEYEGVGERFADISHTFQEAGETWVSLEVESHYGGAVQPTEINSSVCVQEAISRITFRDYNQSMGFDRGQGVTQTFEVTLEHGTDYFVTWTYFGSSFTTNNLTQEVAFTDVSIESISVTVWNNISQSENSISVNVYENVGDVSVDVNGTEVGEFDIWPSDAILHLDFSTSQGSNVTWLVTVTDTITSERLSDAEQESSQYQLRAPGYGADWTIAVQASNPASSRRISFQVQFQQLISGLSVNNNITLYAQAQPVLFWLLLQQGSHVSYSWLITSLSEDSEVEISGETDDVTFVWVPDVAGQYEMRVNASNHLSEATTTTSFTVWQLIPIQINLVNVTTVPYISVDDVTTFDVIVDESSDFLFDVPEYEWLIENVTLDDSQSGQSTITHSFSETGTYEVSVHITEEYKRASHNLTVFVQIPIHDLELTLDHNTSDFFLNSSLTFNLTYSRGSDVQLDWRVINMDNTDERFEPEVDELANNQWQLRIDVPGEYKVRVRAGNEVSQESSVVRNIFIYEGITGLAIEGPDYSLVGDEVLLEASVDTGNISTSIPKINRNYGCCINVIVCRFTSVVRVADR